MYEKNDLYKLRYQVNSHILAPFARQSFIYYHYYYIVYKTDC